MGHVHERTTCGKKITDHQGLHHRRSRWGPELHRTQGGKHTTFVRDLGHGNVMIGGHLGLTGLRTGTRRQCANPSGAACTLT